MADTVLIEGVSLPGCPGDPIAVRQGVFVCPRSVDRDGDGLERLDLTGCVVMPGLVDAHMHLDKTLLGSPWHPHGAANSTMARIENERHARRTIGVPVRERAMALAELAISNGTVALRTHVDVDDDIGLENVLTILDLRATLADRLDIEIVAFPQSGILKRPGIEELLSEALRLGADVVGGLDPAFIDGDAAGHLRVVFDLAEKHNRKVDIHLHEAGAEGRRSLAAICEATRKREFQGRVAVSHAFCLGEGTADEIAAAADDLASAGITIITAAPGATPMPPIDELWRRGVRVAAGSDNVRDLWSPFGNASMIERCMLVAWRAGWRTDDALERALVLATSSPADVLGLAGYGRSLGSRADLVAVRARTVPEAIVERRSPCLVMRCGTILHSSVSPLPS